MRVRRTTWLLLLLLLAGGGWWLLSTRTALSPQSPLAAAVAGKSRALPPLSAAAVRPPLFNLLTPSALVAQSNAVAAAYAERFSHRIANTTKTVGELARSDSAILLENALIDTAASAPLPVPAGLRAPADPGSYIVQARGPVDAAFRAQLAAAGATIVSYIPNNAYLVTAASDLRQLSGGRIQAVHAYEPQFKLKTDLLKLVMERKPLPENRALNVLLFPGQQAETVAALEKLGAKILATDRSPFGPVLTVQSPADAVAAVARLRGVHEVELVEPRLPANDLSRAKMAVATNTLKTTANYLGLTGSNVLVTVSDFGVSTNNPDLAGRVFYQSLAAAWDTSGHGTHIAGIIASSGLNGPTPGTAASGSLVDADFRGKAQGAGIFSLNLDTDSITELQETSVRSNSFINNNSWGAGSGYTLAAASYDAAVRDALPDTTGSQPALYVFAAGNSGNGETSGIGGNSDSITAPATAKNVISVGALEQLRSITNLVQTSFLSTNRSAAFLPGSDSDNQVASYSSRGNVGVGTEGDFGRFKPDLIAPGSWVVSTRPPATANEWDEVAYYNPTNYHYSSYLNQTVRSNAQLNYTVFIPKNAVGLEIFVYASSTLPIYVSQNGTPTNTTPAAFDYFATNFPPGTADADFNYSVGNTNAATVTYDVFTVIATTNDNGDTYTVLSNELNSALAPNYRYESGSSMAAAAVSGTLALMQEFFEQRAHLTNSPALMKALLINGARSVASRYDLQVQTTKNYQGWGLVNLTNSLPGVLSTNAAAAPAPIHIFDQDPTNALATGGSHTRYVTLSTAARNQPLRMTLVWTDPPGDPSAGIKLVNNLDLIVTNLDTGKVYYGNDIPVNDSFSRAWDTNNPANVDFVNNVENVFITPVGKPLGANYSITIAGTRVNVNAVTAHPDNVAQDYALVVSCGNGTLAGALTFTNPLPAITATNSPLVTVVSDNFGTNAASQPPGQRTVGGILLRQRVGANTPLLGTNTISPVEVSGGAITVGITNQWHFYVFVNTNAFTNVAFATFLPPELSLPRIGVREGNIADAKRVEADIDLYVSTNPGLTNLDEAVLLTADKSLKRGGTEVVTFTNGGLQTYYVGVKAEDQMAAEYAFLAVASEQPFSENDNGSLILRGFPAGEPIPDGTAANPGAVMIFGIATEAINIRRVIVTNSITHDLMGDLLGNLSHGEKFAVLNNHTGNDGFSLHDFIYDDTGESGLNPPAAYTVKQSDGPGSLRNFIGEEGSGLWLFTMVDSSSGHTGRVENLTIRLEPQLDTNSITVTIEPGGTFYYFVDVPAEATNLTVSVSGNSQPVDLFLRYEALPTLTDYDAHLTVNPPGGQLTLTRSGIPPLLTGRYYIAVYNPPGNTAQTITLTVNVGLDLNGVLPTTLAADGRTPLLDDAVVNSTISVTSTSRVVAVEVGVRIDHPRESDLALTLISPDGTRVLLSENRGGGDGNGYGSTVITTNIVNVSANGGPASNGVAINVGMTSGTFPITYNFYTAPDQMTVYYGTNITPANLITNTGFISNPSLGPGAQNTAPQTITVSFPPAGAVGGLSTYLTIVINQYGNAVTNTQWTYTAGGVQTNYSYFVFTEDADLTTTPIKYYIPPFRGELGGDVLFSSFETVAPGSYTNPAVVEGWNVTGGSVSVITNPAYVGTNSLALGTATISQTVPLNPGHKYTLSYAYQNDNLNPIAWWPGNNNALDIIGGNNGTLGSGVSYTNGEVAQALNFNGTVNGVAHFGNTVGNFGTNDFTIDFWMKTASTRFEAVMEKRLACASGSYFSIRRGTPPYRLAGQLVAELVGNSSGANAVILSSVKNVNDGVIHHIALVRQGTNVSFVIDGVLDSQGSTAGVTSISNAVDFVAGNSICTGHDGTSPFTGQLDEIAFYDRALSVSQIQAIYAAGSAGKCGTPTPPSPPFCSAASGQVALSGVITNTIAATNSSWQVASQTFTATTNSTTLQFEGLQAGVLLDAIWLVDLGTDAYALPEQSLEALKGERAAGDWTLEIWDNRTGATNLTSLLSWNLSFIFDTTAPSTAFSIGTNAPSFLNTNLAGSTITVNEMTALTVPNGATDPDSGTILSYTLVNPPAGVSITSGGDILWTPTETQGPVTNTITTVVTDNGVPSQSATNTFTVIVNEVNLPPLLPAGTNYTINELTLLTVTNTAADPDFPVNSLVYAVMIAVDTNAMAANGWPLGTVGTNPPPAIDTNGVITWTPSGTQGPGVYTITTVVTDTNAAALANRVLSATNFFTVTVDEVNTPPYWPTNVPSQTNYTIPELSLLTVTNTAQDDDIPVNPLTYTLVVSNNADGSIVTNNSASIDTNGIVTWTPDAAQGPGIYTFTTVVTDTNAFALTNQTLSATNFFTVTVDEVNTPPYWPTNVPSQTNYTIAELSLLTVTNTAQDDDIPVNPLTYTLVVSNNADGSIVTNNSASIDTNGIITWTPDEVQGPGSYTFTTVVTDTNALALTNQVLSATNSFTVTVEETNSAPYFTPGVPTNAVITAYSTFPVLNAAQDDDIPTNTLGYVLLAAPAGATINPNTGFITWTPATNQFQTVAVFTTVVTDDGVPPLSATNTFTVAVSTNLAGFSLMHYNVKVNGATDWSTNAPQVQAIAREITYLQPDIIAFNEIPVLYAYEMTNWAATFLAGYTVVVSPGNDGFIGSAVASRYPISRSESWLDGADLNPFGYSGNFTRDLFEAQIDVPGYPKPLHVFTTHLKSSVSGYADAALKRAAETAAITNFFATNLFALYPGDMYSLSGDFNESSTNTAAIWQLMDSATGLVLTDPVNPFSGSINTDPSTAPSSRIDYIMPCGELFTNISSMEVFRTDVLSPLPPGLSANDSTTASDHLPVLMAFNNPYAPTNTRPQFVITPADVTVLALDTLIVTNAATDADFPPQTLTYAVTITNLFDNSEVTNYPPTIDTNGVIVWTPAVAQSPTTNLLTTFVTDNGTPPLTAVNSFQVVVAPPPPFNITSVTVTATNITLGWVAPSYEQFAVQWASNLAQPMLWMDFTNVITPTPPGGTNFFFIDDGTQYGLNPPRFYQLRLLP